MEATFWFKSIEKTIVGEPDERDKEQLERKGKVSFLLKTKIQDKGSPFLIESSLDETEERRIFGAPEEDNIFKVFALDKILGKDTISETIKHDFFIRGSSKEFLKPER